MAQITFPAACGVCQSELRGGANLALKREGDEYFLDVSQSEKLDWGICPRCKQISCFAFCWDNRRGYCKTCPSFDEAGNCPDCGKVLIGAIEVVETKMFGIPTIAFEETSDRNWIQCDACNRVVCKACCRKPKTGFCNACLAALDKDESKSKCPVVAEFEVFCFDAADRSKAATGNLSAGGKTTIKTDNRNQSGGQIK